MSFEPELLRGVERLLVTLFGGLAIWLGYRLFERVPTGADGTFRLHKLEIVMSRVGPGAFFALFGAAVLVTSLMQTVSMQRSETAAATPAVRPPEPAAPPVAPVSSTTPTQAGPAAAGPILSVPEFPTAVLPPGAPATRTTSYVGADAAPTRAAPDDLAALARLGLVMGVLDCLERTGGRAREALGSERVGEALSIARRSVLLQHWQPSWPVEQRPAVRQGMAFGPGAIGQLAATTDPRCPEP